MQHIVLGMPLPDEMLGAPDWVVFAGCVVESEDDRACESCGTRWVARRRKKPQDG